MKVASQKHASVYSVLNVVIVFIYRNAASAVSLECSLLLRLSHVNFLNSPVNYVRDRRTAVKHFIHAVTLQTQHQQVRRIIKKSQES